MPGGTTGVISAINQEIMRIPRDNTTALIIDIQERLFPHIHENERLSSNTSVLIRGLKELKIPVLVTQQYSRGLGPTIPGIEELFDPFSYIEKTAFSCCDEPEVIMKLEGTAKNFILLAGIETHVCVLQTAIDLLERGYKPVVIEDCVSSRKQTDKKTAIRRMEKEGAIVTSYESVLFELCRYSGTAEFKAISALVK
jgi:nicotinamidase-related amidase